MIFKGEGKVEVDKSSELNDLIVSEGFDYTLDDKGNLVKECKHLSTEIVNKQDATCTEEGYTGDKVCSHCNEVIEEGTIIPALGHEFENGTCTNCGELYPNLNPEDTEKLGDTEDDSEQPDAEQPSDVEKPNTENDSENEIDEPQTGDDASLYLMIGMAVLSTAGLVYLRKNTCR